MPELSLVISKSSIHFLLLCEVDVFVLLVKPLKKVNISFLLLQSRKMSSTYLLYINGKVPVKESKDFVIYSKYQIDINWYQIDIKSKSKWYQSIMIWYRSISILLPRGFLGVANTAQIFAIYFTVNLVNNDTNNACQVLQLVRYFSLPVIKT